jgi:flagellar biosynthesis anti-sigma factor FlgM
MSAKKKNVTAEPKHKAPKARPEAQSPDGAEAPEMARLRERFRQVIDQTPEVRPERVAALRAAIRRGAYKVEARKLANILIVKLIGEGEPF